MPSKARRVASRQSQLNQRRRRQQRGPRGIPAAAPEELSEDGRDSGSPPSRAPETTEPTPAVATADRPTSEPTRPGTAARTAGPPRARRQPLNTSNYVGAELRRILVLASAVITFIVVLAIVLPIIV